MKINAILQGINLNSENTQVLANSVAEELIQEKLKEEKINEYDIVISDDDYKDHECKCGSKYCIGYIISSDDWEKFLKHIKKNITILKKL